MVSCTLNLKLTWGGLETQPGTIHVQLRPPYAANTFVMQGPRRKPHGDRKDTNAVHCDADYTTVKLKFCLVLISIQPLHQPMLPSPSSNHPCPSHSPRYRNKLRLHSALEKITKKKKKRTTSLLAITDIVHRSPLFPLFSLRDGVDGAGAHRPVLACRFEGRGFGADAGCS